MLEDQREILAQIIELAKEHGPDGILIAGDLYDKSMPSAEAVELADWFLGSFADIKIPVWVISGNHDCAQRIAYGSRMLEQAGVYMSRVFEGKVQRYTAVKKTNGELLVTGADIDVSENKNNAVYMSAAKCEGQGEKNSEDRSLAQSGRAECGAVDIYLLPYIRPAQVRRYFPERTIETAQDAVEAVLGGIRMEKAHVSILLMHQFLAGASVCDSEEISVGGSDQVSVSAVSEFDYVALGHLHGPQKVGRESVRYCGSPLKYSFSEAGHKKSVTVVETGASDVAGEGKTQVSVSTIPLIPRRDLREIRGPMESLLSPEVYREANVEDYLHITLSDENPILDAIGKLREVYPNIMRLDFESGKEAEFTQEEILIEEKSPQELFREFFFCQTGKEMNREQRAVIDEIWGMYGGKERYRVQSAAPEEKERGTYKQSTAAEEKQSRAGKQGAAAEEEQRRISRQSAAPEEKESRIQKENGKGGECP